MSDLLKKITSKNTETKNKKKIENLVFLIIILVITIFIINSILKENKKEDQTQTKETAVFSENVTDNSKEISKGDLEKNLENILSTIKNVGDVSVFINYAESSKLEPLYDETTTTSSTEEGDSSGGTRNVTETETQKEVVFSENSGEKNPVTQKTTMPVIQGAVITAKGASDAITKTNIISAVEAVTGLTIDKIQVFEKAE